MSVVHTHVHRCGCAQTPTYIRHGERGSTCTSVVSSPSVFGVQCARTNLVPHPWWWKQLLLKDVSGKTVFGNKKMEHRVVWSEHWPRQTSGTEALLSISRNMESCLCLKNRERKCNHVHKAFRARVLRFGKHAHLLSVKAGVLGVVISPL